MRRLRAPDRAGVSASFTRVTRSSRRSPPTTSTTGRTGCSASRVLQGRMPMRARCTAAAGRRSTRRAGFPLRFMRLRAASSRLPLPTAMPGCCTTRCRPDRRTRSSPPPSRSRAKSSTCAASPARSRDPATLPVREGVTEAIDTIDSINLRIDAANCTVHRPSNTNEEIRSCRKQQRKSWVRRRWDR